MLRFQAIELVNYRCFEHLELSFEDDTTILFAENAGGKTALLQALALGLGLLQRKTPSDLKPSADRDIRRIPTAERSWEPAGSCTLTWKAQIGDRAEVEWSSTIKTRVGNRLAAAGEAIDRVRRPGQRWPLMGYYGTSRLTAEKKSGRKQRRSFQDRWDGYDGCLDAGVNDGPLYDWLRAEAFGDLARHRRGEEERRFDLGVLEAMVRATPGVVEAWYDPGTDMPWVRFENGHQSGWDELSDGYHVFLSLVGDIARRAVILNSMDGAAAPMEVEGVVLVDEIDLHLHPRWQRVVIEGLRKAFPKLQFVLTTHSPQVLSSVKNRQVRLFEDWELNKQVYVEGRDSNAILRDHMDTDERSRDGVRALHNLYRMLDEEDYSRARALLDALRVQMGPLDPELDLAERILEEEG